MMDQTDLGRLEEMVDSLLIGYNRLKKEKSQLLATIESKDREIEELQISLSQLNDEKGDVRQKISSILGSIEDWENDNTAGTAVAEDASLPREEAAPAHDAPVAEEPEADEQDQLFSLKG